MKSTGMVRKIDELGRIVLPIEIRNNLDLNSKDALEIYIEGESIILKKHQDSCVFCGSTKDIKSYKGKYICEACKKEVSKLEA